MNILKKRHDNLMTYYPYTDYYVFGIKVWRRYWKYRGKRKDI
jgi:hypothetical protein